MNDVIFSNSFVFRCLRFENFNYTDNRAGSPSHFFAYMLSGECKITTADETVKIKAGDVFYIPNKCSYQSYWYGEIEFISLGFIYLPNFENRIYPVQVIAGNDFERDIFLSFRDCQRLVPADVGRFYTLTGELMPKMRYTVPCRSKQIVADTKKYLTANPFAKISEIAKHNTISEAALYAAFKKSSDITLNTMRNQILLENVQNMLISTDKSIEYISDLFGFSSASYLRKKFKAHFNMTPGEMRKKFRI